MVTPALTILPPARDRPQDLSGQVRDAACAGPVLLKPPVLLAQDGHAAQVTCRMANGRD
ncbi:hypothetical protein GCM10023174_18030 [Chelativorans composti]